MPAAHGQTETKITRLCPVRPLPSACSAQARLGTGGKAQLECTQPDWALPGALNANINLQQSFHGRS